MNGYKFFRKVEAMRAAQKEYFSTRSKDVLIESKSLEKEIDDEIERVNKVLEEYKTLDKDV